MKTISFFLLLLLWSNPVWALFYEVGGNFSYNKTVYGEKRQNVNRERSYSTLLAIYFSAQMALELNWSRDENEILENDEIAIEGTDTVLNQIENQVINHVWGVGLRLQLAPREALLTPMLSVGYAKQYEEGRTIYRFVDPQGGVSESIFTQPDEEVDSVFGTFLLKFNITETISLNGSVKTVFKAFEWNEARDNIKYGSGISLLF